MKTIIGFVIQLVMMAGIANAQNQTWQWAHGFGGGNGDQSLCIAADSWGNSYITGFYGSDSIHFGNSTIINHGSSDIFIAKYNTLGDAIWAKGFGNAGADIAHGITTDSYGNIYITGYFTSATITFGTFTLNNQGENDFFLVKLDSAGTVQWAKSAGGQWNEYGYCITADHVGNIYVSGYYESPIITLGTATFTNWYSCGQYISWFVAKFDGSGNNLWSTCPNSCGTIYGMHCDDANNLFLAGTYQSDSTDFGNNIYLLNNGGADAFIAKYSSTGTIQWAKQIAGTDYDWGQCVTTDPAGNAYISGDFLSPTLSVGNTTLTNHGNYDIYLAKYTNAGNFVWARCVGDTASDNPMAICTDNWCYVYLSGAYGSGHLTFGTHTIANNGFTNAFIAKYDSAGTAVWATNLGGSNFDYGYSITTDGNNNIYHTSTFSSSTITYGSQEVSDIGNYDGVVGKLSYLATDVMNPFQPSPTALYPNPNNGSFTITNTNHSLATRLMITDLSGREIVGYTLNPNRDTEAITLHLSSGIYFWQLITAEGTVDKGKLVIIGN